MERQPACMHVRPRKPKPPKPNLQELGEQTEVNRPCLFLFPSGFFFILILSSSFKLGKHSDCESLITLIAAPSLITAIILLAALKMLLLFAAIILLTAILPGKT